MRLFLIVICCLQLSVVFGQEGRQMNSLYSPGMFRNRGWFFAPGFTYMIPANGARQETRISNAEQLNDTLYTGEFTQAGRFGLYAEVGRHHFLKDLYIVHHMDYGVHVKSFGGRENFDGRVKTDSGMVNVANVGTFRDWMAGAFFNISNITQISDRTWIQNGVGVNADYAFIQNRDYTGPVTGMIQNFPGTFTGQIHYKLGFGWKPENGVYIMPSIETPILTVYKLDDGKSTLPYFSSRFRPIIVSLRIAFLDKTPDRECKVIDDSGGSPQLWDKEMRKKKRYGKR
ncbi:MAG: hypothetical protein RL220_1974 [Bacteroidota bacterium]